MVKISEERCHIFQSISGASFGRTFTEKNWVNSNSGLDKCFLQVYGTPQL